MVKRAANGTAVKAAPSKKLRTNSNKIDSGDLDVNSMLDTVLKSVVKIYCTYTQPSFSLPWQMERQVQCTSSGFIIEGRKILGNAHGVAWHSSVKIRKHGDSTKYIAKVLHVGHECDLAMLTVEDESFWTGLEPLSLGGTPHLQQDVRVVGYPTGGDNISITKGIVSRIAVGKYSHGDESLLVIQIDAAINSGNSGGPALDHEQNVVGVAFETLDGAENIGYIIPVKVIEHFLQDIERFGTYKGFCSPGFRYQQIENEDMKKFFKLKKNAEHGVLICKVDPLADAANHLKQDDILLEFDGEVIANDGTVKYRNKERVNWTYLVSSKYIDDQGTFTILRDGKRLIKKIKLEKRRDLCRLHMYDMLPSWFIYGGFVFTVVSCPFLQSEYGNKWDKKAPIDLCDKAFYGSKTNDNEQCVVLNQVLTASVNIGYEDVCNLQVLKVNGEKVDNIKQLMMQIKNNKKPYLRLDLYRNVVVIVSTEAAKKMHSENLSENSISKSMSTDLQTEWDAEQKKNGKKEKATTSKAKATATPTNGHSHKKAKTASQTKTKETKTKHTLASTTRKTTRKRS